MNMTTLALPLCDTKISDWFKPRNVSGGVPPHCDFLSVRQCGPPHEVTGWSRKAVSHMRKVWLIPQHSANKLECDCHCPVVYQLKPGLFRGCVLTLLTHCWTALGFFHVERPGNWSQHPRYPSAIPCHSYPFLSILMNLDQNQCLMTSAMASSGMVILDPSEARKRSTFNHGSSWPRSACRHGQLAGWPRFGIVAY